MLPTLLRRAAPRVVFRRAYATAPGRGLTPTQIQIVKSTVPALEQHGVEITTLFYKNMLAKHPELNNIFNSAHQATGEQPAALAHAVWAYATNIEHPEALATAVSRIGHKHASLGVTADQYPIVGEHLLAAIKAVLGDAVTPAVVDAWTAAYQQLADIFTAFERGLYDQAVQTPGGWKGWRKFVISEKVHESDEILSFHLTPVDQGELPTYQPGQFVSVRCYVPELGVYQPRQYSLSDVPNRQYFQISVKKEFATGARPAGRISNVLHEALPPGSEVEISMPFGDFVLDVNATTPVVLMSGGVGLTPMMSMLKSVTSLSKTRPACPAPKEITSSAHEGLVFHPRSASDAAEKAVGMNTTQLEGWQFNDPSRSSWDIVWTCLVTTFACTWVVLHPVVPGRNKPEGLITAGKLVSWLLTFLAPELLALGAVEELVQTRKLQARCNDAQSTTDRTTNEPASWLYHRTKTLAPRLIEAGIISCSDFTDRDIRERAKSDVFAKAFAVIQSTWVTVNIVARAGYDLPITPLEFSTLGYVACAILTYAVWWHKPQGVEVPITVHLRCTRENLPHEVRSLTDAHPRGWVHRRAIPQREGLGTGILTMGKVLRTESVDELLDGTVTRTSRELSLGAEPLVNTIAGLAGFLFSGLHVAAWNFAFPTYAETITWRVFSLTALAMVAMVYGIGQTPLVARWLVENGVPLPAWMKRMADPMLGFTKVEVYIPFWCMLLYAIVRLGMLALTLSSLRALPSGAYITIDWWSTIPHT